MPGGGSSSSGSDDTLMLSETPAPPPPLACFSNSSCARHAMLLYHTYLMCVSEPRADAEFLSGCVYRSAVLWNERQIYPQASCSEIKVAHALWW